MLSKLLDVIIGPISSTGPNVIGFIKIKNKNIPKIVPFGPPPGIFLVVEVAPLNFTLIFLFSKNPITTFRSQGGTPKSASLVTIKL